MNNKKLKHRHIVIESTYKDFFYKYRCDIWTKNITRTRVFS